MSTLSVNNVTEVGGAPVVTGGVLDSGSLPTGTVLQVVSAVYSTAFSTTSASYVDTGLTASITPSSATNKILVIVNQNGIIEDDLSSSAFEAFSELDRGGTSVYETKGQILTRASTAGEQAPYSAGIVYLDSPSSTSTLTYKTRAKVTVSGTLYLQPGNVDSSITLLEIAG